MVEGREVPNSVSRRQLNNSIKGEQWDKDLG